MEAGAMSSNAHHHVAENTFDYIDSPQYLSFERGIPEAKDSYFERKVEKNPTVQSPHFKNLQKLPTDLKSDLLQNDRIKKEKSSLAAENNNNTGLSDNSDNDLIQAVHTLRVNEPGEVNEPIKIITSTPFRVQGVAAIPWKPITNKAENKHCTKPRPFSFEERNKQLLQRKARRAEMILQAEKAARRFRANPVPKFLRNTTATNNHNLQNGTQNVEKKTRTANTPPRFRAKSPKVLRKPAFQPDLPKQPLAPPQPFVLNSELRAKERQLFDNLIKEKERLDENLRKLRETARKRREEEEIAQMRRGMVIKAQPVRKYKTVTTEVSKRPLTEPLTPKVVKRQRR